jgi:hypothetical protein
MEQAKLYFPDHPGDIKNFIPSGVECRMFPDHPGRLPGLCRDVSETVAHKLIETNAKIAKNEEFYNRFHFNFHKIIINIYIDYSS